MVFLGVPNNAFAVFLKPFSDHFLPGRRQLHRVHLLSSPRGGFSPSYLQTPQTGCFAGFSEKTSKEIFD
jgi:hypothetical protein